MVSQVPKSGSGVPQSSGERNLFTPGAAQTAKTTKKIDSPTKLVEVAELVFAIFQDGKQIAAAMYDSL